MPDFRLPGRFVYLLAFAVLSGCTVTRTEHEPEATRFHQDVLVQGSLDEPTEMAVTSDGRVLFVERKGAVKLYDPASGEARLVRQLEVYHESENGLIGLTLDPSFDETGWLYLNYSVPDTLKHRIARFTFTGTDLTDEKVLLEVPFSEGCCHTGGSMAFDAQGNLYVSYGDNANPFDSGSYAPIDPAPGRELMDARRSSSNTMDLRGKILRITPQPDGTYSIPEDNLFADGVEGRPEIYTMGHRNPYRISVDQRTGFLYWGEVGPDASVDSTIGPRGYDEVNQARKAGYFGWPLFIADNQPYRDFSFTTGWQGELFDPQRPVNDSPNNTGAKVLPPAQPAFIYYPYDPSDRFPLVGEGGRNAMAGPVYYYDDYPDAPGKLPRYYDGKFIHFDWMRGWAMAVTMDEEGNFVEMEPFLDELPLDHPIDMQLGPDGSLYLLEYGTYWFAQNQTARLSRITYQEGNRPPQARLTASKTVGAAPLTVAFSAQESSDYDEDDALTYRWDFGDGASAEGATVSHTFAQPGTYTPVLTVRDAADTEAEATATIQVGNTPPEVRIALDGNRTFFWSAAPVAYQVAVTDAEDGALGQGIAPENVRVTFDYIAEGFDRTLVAQGHQANRTPKGLALIEGSDCRSCHGIDQTSVGPSYTMVAERYAGRDDAVPYLVNKVIEGGGGVWGEHSMAAHPQLAREDIQEMVQYILSLAGGGAALPPSGTVNLDRHKPTDEGAYILTASYMDAPQQGIGPLRAQSEVVLRPPVIRAADAARNAYFGFQEDEAEDGSQRLIGTAYDNNAYLYLPGIDLSGVGALTLQAQSFGKNLTVELREGGIDGGLLASKAIESPEQSTWFDINIPVKETGIKDLYVVLRTNAQGLGQWNQLLAIDTIRFERAAGI